MRFSISKSEFLDALNIVSKGRSARSTLPILSGIYISTDQNQLVMQATDLEISVRHKIDALIEEQGEVVIPGKLILEIIKNLPDAAITCNTEGEMFKISCMSSEFSLTTMNASDFPTFPNVQVIDSINMPANKIAKLVKKVSKAVSHDESHLILTGINLTAEDNKLTMAATDSYRLAICEMTIEDHTGSFALVVPGSTFNEVCKVALHEENLVLGYSDNQIIFEFGNTTFITRKIEGTYPNYRQIIPKEKVVSAIVDTKTLTDAVKRTSIMAQDYMQIRLSLSPETQQITISSKVSDIGSAEEIIDAQIEGEDIVIGFNYQYIMDGLVNIDSEEVVFEANNPLKPGVLKAISDDNFFYLSMPVKLNN